MHKIDENDDDDSDYRQDTKNNKSHSPSNGKSDSCSAYKHGQEVEHASYLLSCGLLVSQRVGTEIT